MNANREFRALEAIRAEMENLPGHLGLYYKNLVTGYAYEVRAEEEFLAASVIKLPLFLQILSMAAEGKADMNACLTVEEWEKVPSCGALTLLTGPATMDIRSLCRLMICLSDNTATNKLIRFCTMQGVDEGFRAMGLEKTRIRRLLFDREASEAGIQNYICPREIGMLLEKLYRKEFVSEAVCREAMDTLLKQQVEHKLDGKLCGAVPIAHKTGEDDCLSNDVGIVFAEQPFVICFAGHDTDVYRWEDLIRRAAYELVQAQSGGDQA